MTRRRDQEFVAALEVRVADNLAQRGGGTDLDAVVCLANAAQRLDPVQVNQCSRTLGAVFHPAVGVLAATQYPAIVFVLVCEAQRIVNRIGLIELNIGHDVV